MRDDVLVNAADLAAELEGDGDVVVLDVRWALGRTDGRERHAAGHVPGAVYVDLDTELAAPASPAEGRHPLPALADLQAAARRWGVRAGSRVVAYDGHGNLAAARVWWLLRWAGLTDVRLLDGGLPAWTAAGLPVEAGPVAPAEGDVVLPGPGHLPTVDIDTVASLAAGAGVVLDVRAGERYRGETEPVDPRAGHVPGALSAPTVSLLADDGTFLPPDALRERLSAALDGRPVAVYCGSGINAAHTVVALTTLEVDAALYPGSWSQWSHTSREAATGPTPTSPG